jgi:DNA ligase-1
VVATSAAVAATSSRTAKRDAIAGLLSELAPTEVAVTVGFLTGAPLQGRIGVGWRTLQAAEQAPAPDPTLTVLEIDATLTALAGLGGAGSSGERRRLLADLLGRATVDETRFLFGLLGGELRQGALGGVMADAVARAAGVPATVVRLRVAALAAREAEESDNEDEAKPAQGAPETSIRRGPLRAVRAATRDQPHDA